MNILIEMRQFCCRGNSISLAQLLSVDDSAKCEE